jgi:hypothetical protein
MKRLLCVALLCAVGCSSAPTAEPAKDGTIRNWIPGIFADLYDTVDARIGLDYGFGAWVKFTDLAHVGIFDYSNFGFFGFDSGIFHGRYELPNMDPTSKNGSWDLSGKIGVGLGAEATLHTWEVFDLASSIVGLGYWSLNDD